MLSGPVARGLLLLLAGLCLLPACERRTIPPPAPSAGPRLVVLSPALAVILRDLGRGDLIVGRHGFDAWTDQSIPVCGDQGGLDAEALLRARPTHVLLEWDAREPPPDLASMARRHAWTVVDHALLTLGDIERAARGLGERFGVEPAAVERVLTPLRPRPGAPAVGVGVGVGAGAALMLISVDPPSALGPGSCHHELLERLGVGSALRRAGIDRPHVELDAEDVRRLAPDLIILLRPAAPGAGSGPRVPEPGELAALLGPLAGLDLPAVRHARVLLIDDPECLLPGTNLARLAEQLRAHLTILGADR